MVSVTAVSGLRHCALNDLKLDKRSNARRTEGESYCCNHRITATTTLIMKSALSAACKWRLSYGVLSPEGARVSRHI